MRNMRAKAELVILLVLIACLGFLGKTLEEQVASDKVAPKKKTVIIDAGHGGGDPGKIGVGDILEKDINLQIAKKVKELLEKEKVEVIMTREEDRMLTGEDENTTKAADMKARVNLINETGPQLAVSIHQNSYSDSAIRGAQVFYYANSPDGEKAAKIMQTALLACDGENKRQAKANDTYYLLKRTETPTIIVECGFLTNSEEAQKLESEEYQQSVAKAVCSGILEYLQTSGE